jgi:glycosyltransferase involved in cell wall biosynthesis
MPHDHFQIHSICVVKNEVDIIGHCLGSASQWSDFIYVYDNGSTDGTWEKVLALQNDQIIPWKQDGKVFQESLRGEVFNAFRDRAQSGDWWCRLDSDEFYSIESPRDFLAKISAHHAVVWGIPVEYYLTSADVEAIDFSLPIADLLRSIHHYKIENSEPRFFRHRQGLEWRAGAWPDHVGIVEQERILYKHYKYRTPEQIQKRLTTRQDSIKRGFIGWEHATETDWRQKLADERSLHWDNGNHHYPIHSAQLPNHLDSSSRKLLKQVMHGLNIWA